MARLPTLSPSRITTYLACPVKYKWTYVDERGKWFLRSKSYYSFGSSLHAVLQRFHDQGDSGVTTAEEAAAALEESWINAGYSSPDEASEALAEGRELVTAYVEDFSARPVTAKTVFVEKQLRMSMGEFALLGRIDRIDEDDAGSLYVVDYKSGRDQTSEDALRNDIAMNCYQLLVRNHFPDRRVHSTIIAIRTLNSTTIEPTDAELEQFEADLIALAGEILNRDFDSLIPVPKPICESCDFLSLCLRDPDFKECFERYRANLNAVE